MGYITMSKKEREQSRIFALVKEGAITQVEAAARLRCTDRWVRKKFKRYQEFDDFGLVHRGRGRPNLRQWCQRERQQLIDLLRGEWHGFGPTFATEKLQELFSIKVSREVVRQVMIQESLWQPKKHHSTHRKRRARKDMLGILIQLDGSPHDWFEGRAPWCTLLVFIDDATSQVLWLEFADSESVVALMQATKNYVQKHGIPQAFYTDFGSVFHVNLSNKEGDRKTQWERACGELGIRVNHAHSPQAKGRVERCNQTMQDRLVKDMRLAGISSIEAANQHLRTSSFLAKHNAKFSKQAAQKGNAHAEAQSYDLDDVFSTKEVRVLANDYTIVFNKRIFQLHAEQRTIIRPKNEIVVKIRLDGSMRLWIRRTELVFTELQERPVKALPAPQVFVYQPYKPSESSRRWKSGLPQQSRVKPATPAAEAV
jgi:hypothetical protein